MDIQTLQLITTVILALTLVVATYQTILTRRAVVRQKKHFELEASPWLTGSSLEPKPAQDKPSHVAAWLKIDNVGKTPAAAVSIESQ